MKKKILFFGYHNTERPRYFNLKHFYEEEGYECVENRTDKKGFFPKYRELKKRYRKQENFEAVLVMFPGQHLMPLAWFLTRFPRKKLILDAFISVYDTMVDDRRLVSKRSPYAWFLFIVDLVSCHLADEVLIDTKAHKDFFVKRFHLNPKRVRVIYLEARKDIFHPAPPTKKSDAYEVFFYGSFIPLQGIDVILHAAKILESEKHIHFTVLGKGQTYPAMKKLAEELKLKNVTFVDGVPIEKLPDRIRSADMNLGIFGTSGKALRVIPHKVYDAVACGKPVITERSPAILERFEDGKEVILCNPGDPQDLAKKILTAAKR